MDSNLHSYRIHTLIDITQTGVTSYSKEKEKQRNQQRNWETVSQVLSLRTQMLELKDLGSKLDDIEKYSFGKNFQGQHRIWTLEFTIEHTDLYKIDNDRYAALKADFKIVPIIVGLDETIQPDVNMFIPSGPSKNIYFMELKLQ